MQTPRNGLGMSQSCSCKSNVLIRSKKNRLHNEQHINTEEKYLNKISRSNKECKALKEVDLANIPNVATLDLQRRRNHEKSKNDITTAGDIIELNNSIRTKRWHSKISKCDIYVTEQVNSSYEKQKPDRAIYCLNKRARTRGNMRLRRKTRHQSHVTRPDPHSYTLCGLGTETNVKELYADMQNHYNESSRPSEKLRHDIKSHDPNIDGITKKQVKQVGSNLSLNVEFHMRGSLSFDEYITQKPWSYKEKFSKYGNNIAKENNPDELKQTKSSETVTRKSLCYCSKIFSINTPFINNTPIRSRGYEVRQLRAERQSVYTNREISSEPQHKRYVADVKLHDASKKEVKYGNDVQLFYVFDKPFQHPAVPKVEQESAENSALCQTDTIKNTYGVMKRLYHKFLESSEDAPQVAQCGNTSILCQVDDVKNERSFIKRRKTGLSDQNQHRKSAPQIEQCGNNSVPCQAEGINNEGRFFKRASPGFLLSSEYRKHMSENTTEKCANPSTHCQAVGIKPENSAFKRIFHTVIEPVECKCVSNKLNQINMKAPKPPCTCAEVETQSRRHRNINERNFFKRRNPDLLQPNMAQVTQKCANSSTLCELNTPKNENNTLKRLFNILMDSHECGCVANKLRQIIPLINATKPECPCAEAETQSRRYGGQHQRAGREYFYRDIATSGFPKYTNNVVNPELQEIPTQEVEYENDDDLYYITDKPATINRRVGSNGGNNMKCCHNMPHDTLKCTNSSTFCQFNGTRTEGGVFKRLCHTLLKPKHITQVKQECVNSSILCRLDGTHKDIDFFENMNQYAPRCSNSSTLCQIDGVKNKGGFKKLCHILLETKHMMPQFAQKCCKNRGTLCQVGAIDFEDNAFKRLCQILMEPNESKDKANKLKQINPSVTVFSRTEATTQSRKYGGQQQRAGKEIFRRNRGTSGVPKQRCKKVKKEEEPVYEVVDEYELETYVEPECTCTNKEIGIGTNCNFSFGWYKDRHAYGEPKPSDAIKDTKIAIEQWNEAPLRQVQKVSTKIGACLKTNSTFNFFNTNAATQSRKYRKRDLRAGRETFCKERQTSCVPKYQKPTVDVSNNNVIVNQPVQPPAPDRKAVRLGSDCSFCFEFYRDVPPESPENSKSKANESQPNKNIFSKFIRHRRVIDGNESQTSVPGKSDACTCTDVFTGVETHDSTKQEPEEKSITKSSVVTKHKNKSKKDDCKCENIKKKTLKPAQLSDRPFHIGSSVKFNFNFFKSISPPKATNLPVDDITTKEKCSCGVLTRESGIGLSEQGRVESTRDGSISSECEPGICDNNKNYDVNNNVSSPVIGDLAPADFVKTPKKCLLELMSKKNFKRLINGTEKKRNVRKQSYQNLRYATKPESVCEAKCKSMSEESAVPDQPFRIGSSFSFGYDLKNAMSKHEEITYEEKFPQPEDFSGSQLKTDLFRLIMGKIRKRIKPKARITRPIGSGILTTCDPSECKKRKQKNKSWFSYILDNIKQQRHVNSSAEAETKKFFYDILSDAATKSNKCRKRHKCCRQKKKDSGWFSYILSNIKQEKKNIPYIETDAERFFTQMLSETDDFRSCNCRRGRSRRRRRKQMPYGEYRAKFNAPNKLIDSSSLSEWTPRSRSETTEKERQPCRVRSECCFNCEYNKLDDSEPESQTTHSVTDSNYATT